MANEIMVALRLGYTIEEEGDRGGKTLVSATLQASSHPYKDPELGRFDPRIQLGSDPELSIRISHPQWSDRASSSFSEIRIINVDGFYDKLRDADFEGEIAELVFGSPGLAWADLPYRWRMRVERVDFAGEDVLIIRLTTLAEALDVPVQRERFPDSTPEESARGQLKPLVLGGPLQCPTILLDGNTQRRFVAANMQGVNFVGEGGLEIEEGTDPGEYQLGVDEITLNSEPDLMITVDPIGPPEEVWPLAQTRLAAWETVELPFGGQVQRPAGWTWEQWLPPNRAITRVEDGVAYLRNSTSTTLFQNRSIAPGDYRLRIRMREVDGLTNRTRLAVAIVAGTVTTVVPITSIQASDELVEFTFTAPVGATTIRLQWSRDLDGVFITSEVHFTEISIRRLGTPAAKLDQLTTIIANEMADPPYPVTLMDWSALGDLTDSLGSLELAAYLEGNESAAALLDDLFSSCYSSWWTDPVGKLTCGRLMPPSGTPVLTVDDSTRTSQINVLQDLPDQLNRGQKWARNWSPIPEDRAADDVPAGIKARNAREYRSFSSTGGSLLAGLPQRYRNRLASDFRPGLVKDMGSANPRPHAAELQNYQQPRRLWQAQAIVDPFIEDLNQLQPLAVVELRSARFGIKDGILTRIVGLKLKPLSGQIELIVWG